MEVVNVKGRGSSAETIETKTFSQIKEIMEDPNSFKEAQGKSFQVFEGEFYLAEGDSYTGDMTITTKKGRTVYCVKLGIKDKNGIKLQGRIWDKFSNLVHTTAEDFKALNEDEQTKLVQNISGVYSCKIHIANKDGYILEFSKVEKQDDIEPFSKKAKFTSQETSAAETQSGDGAI
jgi:hypothetical protein